MDALSVYVHVPWCRVICPYCDFNVHRASGMDEERFLRAIEAEIAGAAAAAPFAGRRAATIFLGGGTPSLLAPASVARIVAAIAAAFPPVESALETTLEANPENLEPGRLGRIREAGVNRLSIGVQSFDERHLRTLGRAATTREVREAVPRARGAGFANLSLDLMFGIPGETLDDWKDDLSLAIEAAPEHVSAYGLTYEEGTPFFARRASGRLVPADEDLEAAMFLEARSTLEPAGYAAYEISNFARPGFESRHNRNYWRAGDYLGLGPGAHSHARLPDGARRWANRRDPAEYAEAALRDGRAVESDERLDLRRAASEWLLLGLRTVEGIDRHAFRERVGAELEETFPAIATLLADGLLEDAGGAVRLAPRALLVADAVIAAAF